MALAGSDGVDDHASPDGASPLFSIRGGPRHPADDGPHAAPRVLAVRDGREAPAQFGHGGQLAALVPGVADRSRGLLVHHEHPGSLGERRGENKAATLPYATVVWHEVDMNAPRHPGGTLRLRPREQAQAPPVAPARSDPAEIAARKAANVQREREAHEAALVRRREQTREVLALLRARWPEVFSAPVPLAVGVKHEIREGLDEAGVPVAHLERALHHWTHRPVYLAAVAAGQRRRHLDGTDAGEPDEAQREHARETLAQRAARRRTC